MKNPEEIENITEPVVPAEAPEPSQASVVVDEEEPKGPMRGHKEFPWLKRAYDPSSPTTDNNESVRTESRSVTNADGSTSEVLFPTIRQEEDHHGNINLVQLESEDAFNRAMTEDDYLSFESPEEATQYSTYLSDTIDKNRKASQLGVCASLITFLSIGSSGVPKKVSQLLDSSLYSFI